MECRQPAETIMEKSGEQGFTLLEIFIAMAIFTFGLLAVAGMHLNSINGNASARMHTEGYTLAMDQIEWMSALAFDDDNLDPGTQERDADNYRIKWTVRDDTPYEDTKTIEVTVEDKHDRSKSVKMAIIKSL